MSVVVDTSSWIDFFSGHDGEIVDELLELGNVVLSPIVVAELTSGARSARERRALADLLVLLPLHPTPLDHWIRVGELRRSLRGKGVSVSTPDAHVAQCALDLGAPLLSTDGIFQLIATHSQLRLLS